MNELIQILAGLRETTPKAIEHLMQEIVLRYYILAGVSLLVCVVTSWFTLRTVRHFRGPEGADEEVLLSWVFGVVGVTSLCIGVGCLVQALTPGLTLLETVTGK